MSTNHNRIRVADLETSDCDKILKTNAKGELEFIDAGKLQVDSYNALDCTTEGKTLDARQGKVLKDLIDNNSVNIASDAETQISKEVSEDKKVISRSKLFNWWTWIKSQTQTITAIWNFKLGIKVNNSIGNYITTTQMLENMFLARLDSAGIGNYRTEFSWESIKWFLANGYSTAIYPNSTVTQNNILKWPNKSGTVAITNDFVTTATGTASNAPLTIPNGVLTTTAQNGAIERDNNGRLWTTRNGKKYTLLEDNGSVILLAYNSPSTVTTETYAGVNASNSAQTVASEIGTFPNTGFLSLKMFNCIVLGKNAGTVMPNMVKLEVSMQVNNGFFYRTVGGPRWSQLKIYEKSNLSIPTGSNNTTFYDTLYSEVIETSLQSWSSITLPLKTDNGSSVVTQYTDYSLTNSANNAPLPASQASFSFVFTMTLGYADATNASGQNVSWKISNINKAVYVEKIK